MKFGKKEDVSGVDFTLPKDNPLTIKALSTENSNPLEVYVGPPEWGVKPWIGKIYRVGTKDSDFFATMTQHFNTIEFNSLFYAIPSTEKIAEWKQKAAKNFKFCPKFPKSISHEKKLIGVEAETEQFCNALYSFGDNLGRAFLQFSESYQPNQLKNLEKYLRAWPKNLPMSVELRHKGWFSDKVLWENTSVMLQELGFGTVITDTAGERNAVHMTLTNNTLMLRFLAYDLEPSAFSRIDEWCLKIKDWIARGLKTIYIFVHTHNSVNVPELALYWVKNLNKTNNLRIEEPRIMPRIDQLTLF